MIEWSLDGLPGLRARCARSSSPPRRATSHDLGGHDLAVVAGGATRAQSVANALEAVETELVAIHDAARPLLTPELVEAAGRRPRRRPRGRRRHRRRPGHRHDQAGRRTRIHWTAASEMHSRRRRHARSLAALGGADAAGLPDGGAAGGARGRRGAAGRRHRRGDAGRGGGGDGPDPPDRRAEPQGDDAARPAGGRAAARRAGQSSQQHLDQRRREAELADPEATPRLFRAEQARATAVPTAKAARRSRSS